MTSQIGKQVSKGRALTASLAAAALTLAVAGALLTGCGSADEAKPQGSAAPAAERPKTFEVSLKPDIPEGYTDRVGKYEKPLRQDVTTMKLVRREDGAFNIEFAADTKVPAIEAVDFRPFMPRVPDLAAGNSELKRIALIQRELNRNQTRYPMPGFGSAWIANNCLKKGLWEIGLDKKDEQGNWVTTCHAWFAFPQDEYKRLFAEVNAPGNDPAVQPHADYPELNGLPVAMDALRSVTKEVPLAKIETNLDQPIAALPEQSRKMKLIVAPQAKTYADWVAPDKQPVTTAKFSEPGFYINADPVKFDLAWLGKPAAAQWREAKSDAAKTDLAEVEVKFENGHRLVLASSQLAKLPARTEAPKTEKDVLKVTFGISTPEIYADAPERDSEFKTPANNYLLLLDAQGKHVDNHKAGLDRVFAWRDAQDKLHLYLVGYERIMFVGHLTMPLPAAGGQANAEAVESIAVR